MKLNNLISLSIEALLISFYNCFIFSLRQWSCKIKNKCVNIMTLVLYWANDPLPQSYNYLTMCVSSPPWSSDPRFSHFDCSCSKGINKETNIVFSETYLRKTNSWCKCKQTSVKKVTKSETSIISLFIPLSSPAGILTLQDHFSDYAIFSLHCNILLDIEIAGLFFNFKFCQIEDLLTYWQKPL